MKIIVVLGTDRVGKSSVVEALTGLLDSAEVLHFSGQKKMHDSPIEQYTTELDRIVGMRSDSQPKWVVCDRGFAEVCFYDKFRRRITTSSEWAKSAESYFSSRCESISIVVLQRPWSWSEPFHREEILDENDNICTKYWMDSRLSMRKKEHYAYYKYMYRFIAEHSLLQDRTKILDYGHQTISPKEIAEKIYAFATV